MDTQRNLVAQLESTVKELRSRVDYLTEKTNRGGNEFTREEVGRGRGGKEFGHCSKIWSFNKGAPP